jgi:hypothetical protein
MMDTNHLYARSSDGEYHRTICGKIISDDGAEPIAQLPEDVELENCCSKPS